MTHVTQQWVCHLHTCKHSQQHPVMLLDLLPQPNRVIMFLLDNLLWYIMMSDALIHNVPYLVRGARGPVRGIKAFIIWILPTRWTCETRHYPAPRGNQDLLHQHNDIHSEDFIPVSNSGPSATGWDMEVFVTLKGYASNIIIDLLPNQLQQVNFHDTCYKCSV